MEEGRWQRPEEVAKILGVQPRSVARRARRHEATHDDSLVRRVPPADGGMPRLEIHRDLVERWIQNGANKGDRPPPPSDLHGSELATMAALNAELADEVNSLEIANRDAEIARLTEALMAREFENADLRSQVQDLRSRVQDLGATIAQLTRATN